MTTTLSLLRHPALAQALTRLGLADVYGSVADLEDELGAPRCRTLLPESGTEQLIRHWINRRDKKPHLPPSFNIIAVSRFRDEPARCSRMFQTSDFPPSIALAQLSLETGQSLHNYLRQTCLANHEFDFAVNAAVTAQQEFLFAASSGLLQPDQVRDALGKYAVSMALTSSWHRYTEDELQRAVRYQERSISLGNDGAEAWGYLIDLKIALFDATGDREPLEAAQTLAREQSLRLHEARAQLKIGLAPPSKSRTERMQIFKSAVELAKSSDTPKSYSARAERDLLIDLALEAWAGNEPLTAQEVRLPLGFVSLMPRMTSERANRLVKLVRYALAVDRRNDRRKERRDRRSVVDLQVLTGALTQVLLMRDLPSDERVATADELVDVSREFVSQVTTPRSRRTLIEALLIRADVKYSTDDLDEALDEAVRLREEFPTSSLVALTWARVLSRFDQMTGSNDSSEARAAWEEAIRAVIESPEFRRNGLGGRSDVFALDDAKGELATTFIFKPLETVEPGEREQEQLNALAAALASDAELKKFAVPTSVGIYSDANDNLIHVLERSHGNTLQSLHNDEAVQYLPELIQFLGLIHSSITPPSPRDTSWKELRKSLRMWARRLDLENENDFIDLLKEALPDRRHMVRKRDAHLGNWLIDEAGRITAIDLDSPKCLPAGHDLAQLIEDGALIPVSNSGFAERYNLFRDYLSFAGIDDSEFPLEATYDWFALYRAIWIGTAQTSSKAQHRHSRELAAWIASKWAGEPLGRAATMARGGLSSPQLEPLSRHQRRISKAMARVLRHAAPEIGLSLDLRGFAAIEALSIAIRQTPQVIREIASHPDEPRFQIEGERIRALYGHSVPVAELHDVVAQSPPEEIFHGTAWSALDGVVREGLQSRNRQHVHLTTNNSEALEVGRRHGAPLLFAVHTERSRARLVADAIWSSPEIDKEALRIVNPFAEINSPPLWLYTVDGFTFS